MKLLNSFAFICIISSNLFAQIRINDSFESTTLENQMHIFRDSTNLLTIDSILRNSKAFPFVIANKPSPSFGYDSSHFWVHFKIKNIASYPQEFYFRLYRTAPDKALFYLCKGNKILKANNFDWKKPYYKRVTPSKLVSTNFEIEPNIEYDVYCLFKNKWNIVNFGIEVYSKKEFLKKEFNEDLIHGVLIGGVVLAILMTLYLFTESKELIYLYYSCYSGFSALSVLGLDGVLTHVFGYQYEALTGPQSYQFHIIGTIIFNILFTYKFLEINNKGPKWLVILGRISVFVFTIIAMLTLFESRLLINFRSIFLYVLYAPILIFSLFFSLKRKEILGKFYLLAFLPLNLLMICILASEARIINAPILLPYISLGILFEIFVLLLGLAYRLYDYQRKKQQLESEMTFQVIHSQETERQRIAQDLHDEVGNSLAALKNYISQTNLELGEKINKIAQDVRNISHNLASIDFEKTTLSVAFQNLINRHNEAENIDYELIEVGISQKLPAEKELVIYRIVCELLNNIQKHSKAKKATLQLVYEAQNLTIIVEDDGIGIKTKSTIEEGIGLKHIQTRVAYLNAQLTIDDDGKGTIVVIDVPISA